MISALHRLLVATIFQEGVEIRDYIGTQKPCVAAIAPMHIPAQRTWAPSLNYLNGTAVRCASAS